MMLLFASRYLCEATLSKLAYLKGKAASNIKLRMDLLIFQAHSSHKIEFVLNYMSF